MKKNQSILFFANFPPPHTGQSIVTNMNYHFLQDEFDLDMIDTSSGKFHIGRGGMEKVNRFFKVIKNYWELYKKVKGQKYDHLYMVASSSVAGHIRDWITILIAKKNVSSITAHIHSGNFGDIFERGWHQLITRKITRYVDTYIFLSETLSERVERYLSPKQIQIVPNTTDPAIRCSAKEVENKIQEKACLDDFTITFLSNMIPSKGYWDLLNAVSLCNKEDRANSFKVNFMGNWPDEKQLELFGSEVSKLMLENQVNILGPITDREKIRKYLLNSDVFVLPTYYPVEAQPISIIEAMNAGTPIIATNHASIPDYVINGENGYLVEKKDHQGIAAALIKLTDKENWEKKARAARETYEEIFSPEVVKQKLDDHFNNIQRV